MKKDIGFRLSMEAHFALKVLARKWDCTRTHVIEEMLRERVPKAWKVAAEEGIDSRLSVEEFDEIEDVVQSSESEISAALDNLSPKILPNDPKKVAAVVADRPKVTPAPRGSVVRVQPIPKAKWKK